MQKKLISLIVLLLAVICAGLSFLFFNKTTYVKLHDDYTYYYLDSAFRIKTGSKMLVTDSYVEFDAKKDGKYYVYSIPVYLSNDDVLMTTKDMAYYKPLDRKEFNKKSLPVSSRVSYYPNDKSYTFTKNKKTYSSQNGFLYDGHNTYIFLEDMNVTYNGQTIKVPALSYVQVELNNWIQLFNYGTKEVDYVNLSGLAYASDLNNYYKLNLANDTIEYDDMEIVLNSNIEVLFDVFKGE